MSSDASNGPGYAASAPGPSRARPQYVTVGSGPMSHSAAQLRAILDQDDDFGTIADGEKDAAFSLGALHDRPTPSLGADATEQEQRARTNYLLQQMFDANRTALVKAINQTLDLLEKLKKENEKWPAHFPTIKGPPTRPRPREVRPGMVHTQSTWDNRRGLDSPPMRPPLPNRTGTSLGEHQTGESSRDVVASPPPAPAPRLTSEAVHDYSILKIDLQMTGLSQEEINHSLNKQSVASLLGNQIKASKRHLLALRDRIEDKSSKVLVTGDLNAGKSTFCNALLRRSILPVDEQPCTSIFCEILDSKENRGLEEVHAIPHNCIYDRNDERTYQPFPLTKLDEIVTECDKYSQCKIYVQDVRPVEQSLLNNGVVDIALIDAPGLNSDSLQTTAVFARQEEIDVVVFVVSAANQFTISARDFIFNAAKEKAYMFMITHKERCRERVLGQIAGLSPATHKEASELVHFVSSNMIPVAPAPSGPGGPGGDPDSSFSRGSSKGKGKQRAAEDDFGELETSLRRFVLEKRSRSKLAPAKTYLLNILGDLGALASTNEEFAQRELDRVTAELNQVEPEYEKSKKARSDADQQVINEIEQAVQQSYNLTRSSIDTTIAQMAQHEFGIEYPGFLGAFDYADDLKEAMLGRVADTVYWCEDRARDRAAQGFNAITNIGVLHLGDKFATLGRLSDMFTKSKHALARQVDFEPEISDFFDFAFLWEQQEKVAGTGMAFTIAGVVGSRLIGGVGWLDSALAATRVVGIDNARRLFLPGLLLSAALCALYTISQIPQSLPRRLSTKLSTQLVQLDYTHVNARRISSEVQRALNRPANKLRAQLQSTMEVLEQKKQTTTKVQMESEVARKYFSNLFVSSREARQRVLHRRYLFMQLSLLAAFPLQKTEYPFHMIHKISTPTVNRAHFNSNSTTLQIHNVPNGGVCFITMK
ncbi:hypothetical protein K470DRAFT_280489 [Piedraia hortae CBS 480.64]|uniref:Dynamin-type G domain-containing protein n=1 Tax=Piedraia hortae CBS 480.64 TaxID=1314780 RepID=A0A6A7C9C8_9PEZI|nr:hypothetical protein K470DRAFT_280489 [Piedraia hortae CBS 480.64]